MIDKALTPRGTALVTGASAGIGKALAQVFARHGFDVALTARREDRLKTLAGEIARDCHVKTHVIADDLADPAAPRRLFEALSAKGVVVDALVNNAGYAVPGGFAKTKWEEQRDLIQVLMAAPCHLAHLFLPGMIERRHGYILNVASVAGLMPGSPGHALYGPAKSFLIGFSQSLHIETLKHNVHVSALCPGFTYSEFHDVTGTRAVVSQYPKYMWKNAEDVAEAGYAAVMANKPVRVTGWFNHVLWTLRKALPENMAFAAVKRRSKRMAEKI